MSVRVRFAPSPTGYLHIGGARTALFNWLYARHTGGTFILRVEDTDEARNTQEAVNVILEGLRWLGLEWDEGPLTSDAHGPSKGAFGPYFQSQRKSIYAKRVQELKDKGLAYEDDGAVRFRMTREPIVIPDVVVGDVTRPLTDREEADPDFIIVRSDGQPVFHFVNVVDDLEMGITHVIRGEDHLSNTPKHIAMFRAFGVEAPKYAHIPLILNPNGSKMSKRDVGASLATYMEGGLAPEAVVNFLCLLGWSPKNDREILALKDLVDLFDLSGVQRHNARFDAAKLNWINAQYIQQMSQERFDELAMAALNRAGVNFLIFGADYLRAALRTCKGKVKLFSELPAYAGFYFSHGIQLDAGAARKEFTPETRARMNQLRLVFGQLNPFEADAIEAALKRTALELKVKPAALVHPTRLACTGQTIGPSLYHLLEVLGKDRVMHRLDRVNTQPG